MENYKVSIVIPTYKRPKGLLRAVESCIGQDYENIEILVIDDNKEGSEERIETEKLLEKYKAEKKLVYYKNPENIGGAESRNVGIKKASGDYTTFLDDDDIYLKSKVSSQVNFMIENDLDLSFTDAKLYNDKDELIDYRKHDYVTSTKNEDLLVQHILHRLTATPTFMFRTKALRDLGGFPDVKMGHEYQLMLKSIESGLKIGYLPECHVKLYVHKSGGISSGSNKVQGEKDLFRQSKTYFPLLKPNERRYVRFRYHTVLMVVAMRGGKPLRFIQHFFLAVFSSPGAALNEVRRYIKNFSDLKKESQRE